MAELFAGPVTLSKIFTPQRSAPRQAYAWVGSLATQATTVGWVSPTAVNTTANPEAHPIPWMGVADFMGLEVQEATEHLTAAVWSLVHPNLVPDPQVGRLCGQDWRSAHDLTPDACAAMHLTGRGTVQGTVEAGTGSACTVLHSQSRHCRLLLARFL